MTDRRERPRPSVSVVVPVFGGVGTLPELVARLEPVLAAEAGWAEIVLVDDDGPDASWETIRELAGSHPRVRGIALSRNYGQHAAVLAGIRAARGDVVVTLDDDLQQPPEAIPALLGRLEQGCDVVYGTPVREQHGLLRDLASRLTKLALQSAMGAETARMVGPFRAFRTRLRDAFAGYESPFVNVDVLLTWATTRFAAVPVQHAPRPEGRSGYTFGKLVRHALDMTTGFSVLPLQLASLTGFAFTLFGTGVLVYVVARYLAEGTPVPGFPFLASIIAIFAGAQLFALGIIGEYLARMHFRLMGRPSYTVRAATDAARGERPPEAA
jgi:undecaprenyl-phosphate 4-deoxy-4-formamido-L-arabinose transferase